MKVEIPDFLKEMSEQINTQDNHITADPMFCVYYDKKVSAGEDYAEGYEYCHEDGVIGDFEALKEHLNKNHPDFVVSVVADLELDGFEDWDELDCDVCDLPCGIFKYHYQKVKTFVKASFTEAGAKQFIKRKQHDYPPLYIYVESMVYQHQMIELRNWIKSLASHGN